MTDSKMLRGQPNAYEFPFGCEKTADYKKTKNTAYEETMDYRFHGLLQ